MARPEPQQGVVHLHRDGAPFGEPGRDKTWRVDAIDFIRVRVRAVFPRAGSLQFVDGQRVDEAVARPLVEDPTAPLIMGVDIARQGVDQSIIRFRWGLDARSIPAVKFRIPDLMQVASRVQAASWGR
jgi:hypothetical protein